MKIYLNKINHKKIEFINIFLLEKRIIDKKIEIQEKTKLKQILDGMKDEDFVELQQYLKKKKNYFSVEYISELQYELDCNFENKYHFPKIVISTLLERIKTVDPLIDEKSVLYTIYYLKHANSFALNAQQFKVSSETYRRNVWDVLEAIGHLECIFSKKCFKERSKYQTFVSEDKYFSLIVDGTFAPYKTQDIAYKGIKGKGVIYQFAIISQIGVIIDFFGPVPASFHDIHTFKKSHLNKMPLLPGERILGDKGYEGCKDKLLVPYCENENGKGTHLNELQINFNNFLNSQRQLVERTLRFLKYFKFLTVPWTSSLIKHRNAVCLLVHLHNISVELNTKRYDFNK